MKLRQFLAVLGTVVACVHGTAHAQTDYNGDGRSDLAFHSPGTSSASISLLRTSTSNTWTSSSPAVPTWANQPDVVSVPGDYNGDRRTDIAFYRPGGPWNTVPVLLSTGTGFTATNYGAPSWAHEPGVVAVRGDFNRDGRADLAFHRPGSSWTHVRVLFSTGTGAWTSGSYPVPSWANQPGTIALAGDYNYDGRSDIAFHRPGSTWTSVPVLFGNGSSGFTSSNYVAPSWANQLSVVAIPGDFNRDGRADIAFHRPDGVWNSLPVLLGTGTGSWTPTNYAVPGWANQLGAVAIAGDYNYDGRTDIAFHLPGSTWTTVPVLLSNGNGSFSSVSSSVPSWANQSGVVALPGDYNGDRRSDIAFHRPGGTWTTVPVLISSGNGTFTSLNAGAPSAANALGAIAVKDARVRPTFLNPTLISDEGDEEYDRTQEEQTEWSRGFQAWMNFLRLFVRVVLGYEAFLQQNGLTGRYDGQVSNGQSTANAYLELEHQGSEVHGRLAILDSGLELDGGFCPNTVVPASVLPVHATSSGSFRASGTTEREVDILGVVSGTADVTFNLSLETTNYEGLTGTIQIDAPWPCADQTLSVRFTRRNSEL